ncbi:hypothetical protein AB6735_14520 [Mucilaginibacter sp. RCC_168]|uniref:phosphorylase family protein n=1 Tax=Mucilaginibacter sp. RCC_168 TaxID=3239221 RepID=UPI0035239EF6
MSKINLIILGRIEEKTDMIFYKVLLRQNSLLFNKAVVQLFSVASQFFDFLDGMPDDFSFVLLVHAGLRNDTEGDDGINFAKELRSFKAFEGLKFEYTSRDGAQNKSFNGGKLYHANTLADDDFDLSCLPVNTMRELRGKTGDGKSTTAGAVEKSPAQAEPEVVDFAVVTALYDDEFKVYEADCNLETGVGVYNSHKSIFKEKRRGNFGEDYDQPFYVIHQERMGLVDGAIHATQVISQIQPTFLLMSGVCGGRQGSVNLYDVIIPSTVHDYATGKFKEGKFESLKYYSQADRDLISFLEKKREDIILNMRLIIDKGRAHLLRSDFKIVIDEFACGPWVVKTSGFIDKMSFDPEHPENSEKYDFDTIPVKNINSNIKGLEMESYSILRAGQIIQKSKKYALVVKSVMDFTNEHKSDGPNGSVKANAAYISYICVRAMMPYLLDFKQKQTVWK